MAESDPSEHTHRDADVLRFPSNRPARPDTVTPETAEEPSLRGLIGDVLREERHRQGRTLADVADGASVSLPYLSEIERGTKEVSSDVLHSVTRSLDLPLVEVLERSAERLRTRVQGNARIELRAA